MGTTETETTPIKELHRSQDDRILAGVAGGLGRYFDISPNFFRVGFAILTLVGGAGILLYVAAALVIPDDGRTDSIVSEALRRHRDRPWLLAGVALVAIALVSLIAQADFWPNSGFAWTLLLLGGLAIVIAQRRTNDGTIPADTEAPAARPRQPSLFVPVLGLLLAGFGFLALLSALDVDVPWDIALAVGAVVAGVAVVAGAVLQRRTGGLLVVGLLLGTLAVAVSAIDVRLEGPIGDRDYRPFESADVERNYDVAIGQLVVDLSTTSLAAGETEVDANVGIGDLIVVVPDDVVVDVDAEVSAGEVTVFGRSESGFDSHITSTNRPFGADGTRTLRLEAHVGAGHLVVREERP
jgi:phage shock protein PspC (stress-responsive transcriptional regulator)